MSIPLATTLVTIMGKRPQSSVDPDAEGYDAPAPADGVLAIDVRASITLPDGTRGKDADAIDIYTLRIDPIEVGLSQYDQVIDQQDGKEYEVVTAVESKPLDYGLHHIMATIHLVRGLNSGGVRDESS